MNIHIPNIFGCYNAKIQINDWNSNYYYGVNTKNSGKASDCIKCRQCENVCTQHLKITDYLKEAVKIFERK